MQANTIVCGGFVKCTDGFYAKPHKGAKTVCDFYAKPHTVYNP